LPNLNPFHIESTALLSIDKQNIAKKPIEHAGFNPYQDNGGNVIGVAGRDFAVVACDTRLSVGYNIISRDTSKITQLTKTCFLISSGMFADLSALRKYLQARITMYEFDNGREPSIDAIGYLVQQTLYSKRFFPYYCWVILAGVDSEGKGVVFEYDPVGTIERLNYSAKGSASELLAPSLDAIFKGYHQKVKQTPETKEEIEDTLRDFFNAAGERDIYTGDFVEIFTIQAGGVVTKHKYALRKD